MSYSNAPAVKPLSRREVVLAMGLGLAAPLLPSHAATRSNKFFQRHDFPIGVQLYSVADLARQDMADTLKQLAAIGYRTTELAGYLGRTPNEIRRLHDEAGLRCTSAHVQFNLGAAAEPGFDGDMALLAAQMQVIGVSHVIVPSFPTPADLNLQAEPNEGYAFNARVARSLTEQHWQARAALLNDRAQQLRIHGLKIGYHNHSSEFTRNGGRSGMEILLAQTDPKLVTFELDVGWAFSANQDPAALLRAHPGRFRMIHIKDMQSKYVAGDAAVPRSTEVGSGLIHWKDVLGAAYASGAQQYFVEQEPPFEHPPLQAMARSINYLQSLTA